MLDLKNSMAPLQESTGPQVNDKERFYRYFQQEATHLQDQISRLGDYSLGEKQDAIDHVLSGITRLSNDVSDSSGFITAYDQRTYSQAIKALEEKLQETRSKLTPKSRFQFKTKHKNNSALSINDVSELAAAENLETTGSNAEASSSTEFSVATASTNLATSLNEKDVLGDLPSFQKNYNEEITRGSLGAIRKPSFSQAINVDISGHTGLHIILPSSASRATSSSSLTQLSRCIVDMSGPTANKAPFAGLAIKNVRQSLIIAGHVASAAHITGVEDSIIVVASRQVRMHDCKNVDIYLQCASRPIIEDCTNIRFCPMPECYLTSTDEPTLNQWDQVDDFKWLKAEHSPNWSILHADQRLQNDIWTKVVPGSPGAGPEDILKKVGIKGK